MIIRQEHTDDYDLIRDLITAAFGQPDEAHLVEALRHDPAYIPELSLVAQLDTKIVGHILFTRITIQEGDESVVSLALAPMAVDPLFQNKGIGSALVRYGHDRARELGYMSVIVLGHPGYYPRFGYKPASHWGIRCPFVAPDDAFMAMELKAGALDHVHGTVVYSAPFSQV